MYEQVFLKNLIIGWVVITFVLGNNSLIHRMHSRRDAELQESAEKTIFSRILTNKGTASCDCKKKNCIRERVEHSDGANKDKFGIHSKY